MTILWPKNIKLSDVVDALDDLAEQVANNSARLDVLLAQRDATIAHLQDELDEHMAGAITRQAEVDKLQAQVNRQGWYARTGRKP